MPLGLNRIGRNISRGEGGGQELFQNPAANLVKRLERPLRLVVQEAS